MPVNFLGLGGLFGVGNGLAGGGGEAQGQAAQGQAGAAQQAVGQAAINIDIPVPGIGNQAFNENPWGGRAVQFQEVQNYNYVIRNDGDFGFQDYGAIQQAPVFRAARPRQDGHMEAIENLARSFLMEGMEFSEIVVSRNTFNRLQMHMNIGAHLRFNPINQNIEVGQARELSIATSMGMVRFVCEDKPKGFDLSKYMETVE